MTLADALFSSATPEWRTPNSVLDRVRRVGLISLDPCAHPCGLVDAVVEWYGPNQGGIDGLKEDWNIETKTPGVVFVNPPYGKPIKDWSAKCALEHLERGVDVVALLPARTDTSWWQETVPLARCVCFWRGRIKFLSDGGEVNPAPFPSAIVLWTNKNDVYQKFYEAFHDTGWLVQP